MLFSTAVDFRCGLIAGRRDVESGVRRAALVTSIVTNLALLGFFKYANFGIDNYNALVTALGGDHLQWETFFRITLPLGISFYTFQSMSYTIDVYRRHAEPVRNFVDFACYVALFPQLVAGPIVRFREVADQLRDRGHSLAKFARGVSFFAFGMAKKILIANPCGKIADVCFEAGSLTVIDAWYGIVAYSFQIYFDFSAYSDMAIGLGLMLGFAFPKNFDSPYLSQSITEFWRRWHLSLSSFLRDYLYIPLGGNRKGERRTYVNLMTVMLLGGLWHGALWNFVIWGGIHGVMLAVERRFEKDSLYRQLPGPAKMAVTFLIVTIAWVFFRAPTLGQAVDYLGGDVRLECADGGRSDDRRADLPAVLRARDVDRRGRCLACPADVEFHSRTDLGEGRVVCHRFRNGPSGDDGPGVQPVHLLHFLTMASLSIERERQAREELGVTSFSRGVKGFLFGFFVAIVGGGTAWHLAAELVDTPAWPRALDPTRLLPGWEEMRLVASEAGWPSSVQGRQRPDCRQHRRLRGRSGGSLAP